MNKIEPQYIDFPIAKLLKEKGVDIECMTFYTKPNSKMFGIDEHGRTYPIKNISEKLYRCGEHAALNDKSVYFAPAIWQVVEFLRLEYGIWITIETSKLGKFNCRISKKEPSKLITIPFTFEVIVAFYDFTSPQGAYLAAFDYILKELI